tara:strand:- start:2096 stop:2284 length:189 start_codon:yes stop_codon:yes gene_type:complete
MKPERKLVDVKQFLIRKEIPPVWGVEELDAKRADAIKLLGNKWLLHPKHAPIKGDYNGWPKK